MSGVSSMMTSTPVASSNARMFRPSRPMMRPFISSFGSETADTVVSDVCSAAIRWIASAMIFFASRSALRFAVSRISRMLVRRVGVRLLLHPLDQLGLGVLRRKCPASCSSRRRSSPRSLSSSCSRWVRVSSRDPMASVRRVVSRSRCSSMSYLRLRGLPGRGLGALPSRPLRAGLGPRLPTPREVDQLFLSGEHGGLARAFSIALRIADYSFGCLFGRGVGLLLPAQLGAPSESFCRQRKKPRWQVRTEVCRLRVTTPCSSYEDLCWARGKATGGPYRAGKSSRS